MFADFEFYLIFVLFIHAVYAIYLIIVPFHCRLEQRIGDAPFKENELIETDQLDDIPVVCHSSLCLAESN